jgi:hypothetical protein
LRLIVKCHALGTFIGHDIKIIGGEKAHRSAGRGVGRAERLASERPVRSAFIDRVVRAFRFTCTTVDAFRCNHDGHGSKYLLYYYMTEN